MTALLYFLGVFFFVVAILISIGLHELGHMFGLSESRLHELGWG